MRYFSSCRASARAWRATAGPRDEIRPAALEGGTRGVPSWRSSPGHPVPRPEGPATGPDPDRSRSGVVTYVAGAAALVWLSGTVVGAINAIPVLPKVMELVGLGYSSWFVYRYVLYKDSRKELVEQFDALKNKVSGEF